MLKDRTEVRRRRLNDPPVSDTSRDLLLAAKAILARRAETPHGCPVINRCLLLAYSGEAVAASGTADKSLGISSTRHELRRRSGLEIDPASDERHCRDFAEPSVISPVKGALLAIRLPKAEFVHQMVCKLLRHTNENLWTGRLQEATQEPP